MTLTDKYVAAVVTRTQAAQREDIELELRASIADAVEARVDDGEDASAAEAAVLNQLGDPERLAATYTEKPLYLIGPRLFLTWKRLVVLLLEIVVPIIAALTVVGGIVAGNEFWAIFGSTMSAAWGTALLIVVVVTVIFAILERAEPQDVVKDWTVDSLPTAPEPTVTWSDTIGSVITLVVTAAFIIWQQAWPWAYNSAGEGLPIINPDLWNFVLPALLVVMAIELVTVIARQVRGRWTMRDWWVALAVNVAVLALWLPSLLQHTFLNRELFTEIGWPDAASPITLDQLELLLVAAAVASVLGDLIPGWRKARAQARASTPV